MASQTRTGPGDATRSCLPRGSRASPRQGTEPPAREEPSSCRPSPPGPPAWPCSHGSVSAQPANSSRSSTGNFGRDVPTPRTRLQDTSPFPRSPQGPPHQRHPSSTIPTVRTEEEPTQELPLEEAWTKGESTSSTMAVPQPPPMSPHLPTEFPSGTRGTAKSRHPATLWHGGLAPWGQRPAGTRTPMVRGRAWHAGSAGAATECLWSHRSAGAVGGVSGIFLPSRHTPGPCQRNFAGK